MAKCPRCGHDEKDTSWMDGLFILSAVVATGMALIMRGAFGTSVEACFGWGLLIWIGLIFGVGHVILQQEKRKTEQCEDD